MSLKKINHRWIDMMVGILIGILVTGLCFVLSAASLWDFLKTNLCR